MERKDPELVKKMLIKNEPICFANNSTGPSKVTLIPHEESGYTVIPKQSPLEVHICM